MRRFVIDSNPVLTEPTRYNPVAIFLHWLLAVAIIGSLCVGLYMTNIPMSPTRIKLYNWHKWAGIVILALSAARLLWRLTHTPPPLLASTPQWQRLAAHAGHAALYVFFFAVPLVGWAYSSAAGFPIVLFGAIPLPDWVPKDRALAEVLKPIHQYMAYALAATIIVHIAAALKHQFIDRDQSLSRMGLGKP